jgi:CRP/FNR family transcriptional regulator, dissimilatory nitrate respiration regulator
VAEAASRVAAFPKMPLLELLRKRPELSEEFMAMLAKRFNEVRVRLELRNLPVRERVVQYLSLGVTPGNNELLFDRPLKYIAEDLGLAPESFYRELAQLVKDGSITRKGRSRSILINFRTEPARDSAQAGSLRSDETLRVR